MGIALMVVSVAAQSDLVLPVAQEMPSVQGCGEIEDHTDRRICNDEKIMATLKKELEYPSEAKTAGIEGHVIVHFIVDEKGKTTDYTVEDDPGYGMGEAAIKAVKKIGKWTPGSNHGTPVKVRMSIPVKFELPKQETSESADVTPDVYVIADQMPRFQGCTASDEAEARQCTYEAVLAYTRSHLAYPAEAQKQQVTGDVVIRFVVDAEGAVRNATVIKGIGGGCDEEALRLVEAMPAWTPGRQGGKDVKVELTLPVRFALSEKE